MIHRLLACLALATLACATAHASTVDACNIPPRFGVSDTAKAIVRTACEEHRLWRRPFLDREGRLASLGPTEAESETLADDGLIAWQRVARYWRDSGTLVPMAAIPGAQSCMLSPGTRESDNDCRAFLIDNPWSAAFISWVMVRSGVAGFAHSPRHIDYIRAAHLRTDGAPYRLQDPATARPAPGDLLCFLRQRDGWLNYAGLVEALKGDNARNWPSHCEVVVAVNPGGDRTLYLVGGNVANTVVMRMLPLTRTGQLDISGVTPGTATRCAPDRALDCNFNQQDWAALLQFVSPATPASTTEPAAAPRTELQDSTGP